MATYGVMGVDSEIRCDFDKLRKDRLTKANNQLKKEGLGSVLVFEQDNIRYITGTKLGEGFFGLRSRYALLCADKDPILFEMGSAIPYKRMLSPFMKDIRPLKNDMKGIIPPESGFVARGVAEIVDILKEYGLKDAPLGIDDAFMPWVRGLEAAGINVVDGQQCMLNAQEIKTDEEVYLIEMAAAAVDAGFYRVLESAKPGVKENEVANVMRSTLIELGAEAVHNAQVTTGTRTHPHPHDVSDRVIRPGDMIFMDVVNDFMGYKTCYYRTFVCGRPTADQKRIYNKAYNWLDSSVKICRPGITTADIASQWPTAKEMGFEKEEDAFLLQLAHGIGISHWAKPAILLPYSIEHPELIKENMVIAVENYYGEGENGARIEQEIVITKDGNRILTKFPCEELMSTWNW